MVNRHCPARNKPEIVDALRLPLDVAANRRDVYKRQVGIEMHTGKMSFDEAVAIFQKEGYQSKETATVETKRGAGDPTYLYYTLGKLEICLLYTSRCV